MSFGDAALDLFVPLVAIPTVLAVCALFAIPAHRGWANCAHSWLEFKEFIIADTFYTIEVAVVGAFGNWNLYLLAFPTILISSVPTLAHTVLSIPILIIVAVGHKNTLPFHSSESSIALTRFSLFVIAFIITTSWNNFFLAALASRVSLVPIKAYTFLTVEYLEVIKVAFYALLIVIH